MDRSTTKRTLNVEEAADQLGVSRGLAYRLVAEGAIPSLRLGGRILIPQRVDSMLDGDQRAS